MKKIITTLLFACTMLGFAQAQQKVLFIGNSYTYTNNLPSMLQTLAADCGTQLTTTQCAEGGYWFSNHINDPNTRAIIRQGGWDFVVLQEQSQLPAFPFWMVNLDCLPYATQICDSIRKTSPNAKIAFYMTWGRKNGDATLCSNYPNFCTYLGMDTTLYNSYMLMGEQNEAIVAPVGRVWREIRSNFPTIELYSADESHPSMAGTYAAAVTIYSTLLKQSPSCITNNAGLNATDAANIRETVKTVVYDHLDFWYAFTEKPAEDPIEEPTAINDNYLNINELAIFPNPTSESFGIITENQNRKFTEVQIFDLFGKLLFTKTIENGNEVDVTHLTSGVYIVRVMSDGGFVGTAKIVKQ